MNLPRAATTGIVSSEDFCAHEVAPGHPERSERIAELHRVLSALDPSVVQRIHPGPARQSDLELIHTVDYLERLADTEAAELTYLDSQDCSVSSQSNRVARLATGSAVALLEEIARGHLKNGFAAIRPPGHHAEADRAMGFCFLNTIAVLAAVLQRDFGVRRILLIDWDVHHGNGSQHSFYETDAVFFCSIHQHPLSLYPGTGFARERGRGKGEGYTLNLPVAPGAGRTVYQEALAQIERCAKRYQPEWVLLSAGFDAHREDSISQIELGDDDFAFLTEASLALAAEYCDGRFLSVLEGGYNLEVLSRCVLRHVEQLIAA